MINDSNLPPEEMTAHSGRVVGPDAPADDLVRRLDDSINGYLTHHQRNILEREATAAIEALQAEVARLKDALDMETQGKYSALMLELADERAEQLHAGLEVCTLKGDLQAAEARAAAAEGEVAKWRRAGGSK